MHGQGGQVLGAAGEPLRHRKDAALGEKVDTVICWCVQTAWARSAGCALGTTLHTGVFWRSLPLPRESIHICKLFWFIHGWLTPFLKQWDANL